jgi:phospholipid/cholesterol/gamma-HCH transport system permease protein
MVGRFCPSSRNCFTFQYYFDGAFSVVNFVDYVPATLKTLVFGYIIGTISCYLGYTTSGGTAGVGQASTRSVVYSSISVILSNVILVKAIFFFFPEAQA